MAAKLLTTEEKNYLRSIYLTFMIGTDAVRIYFDQLHPPTDLVAHLANNKSAFESLKKDGIISKAVWEKLYPKRGECKSLKIKVSQKYNFLKLNYESEINFVSHYTVNW
ncbi:Hypothetical predicted protein [Mytilus galloprovincialis]|uniref:Uncharacterized protein n=1 Tax=Mytilus galloprovincialis TaxID=29158 RepID=A0A8B6CA24_MYTGA|nr:Hypothetical predicted protein [Mytilus galloprovincialis]